MKLCTTDCSLVRKAGNDKTLAPSLAPLSSSINQSSPSSSGHGSSPQSCKPASRSSSSTGCGTFPSFLNPFSARSFLPPSQCLSELLVLLSSFLLCVYPASSLPVQAQPSLNQPPPRGPSLVLTISTRQPPPPPRFAQRPSLNAVRLPHPPSPRSAQSYTPRPLAAQWLSEPPCAPPLWTSMSAGLDRPGLSFPTKCSIGETPWV